MGTDLRSAAEKALKALEGWKDDAPSWWTTGDEKTITALKAALEQPEQEPVAWRYQNSLTDTEYLVWNKGNGGRNWTPLYTHPPRREWRGLTEGEINDGREQLPTEDLCNWSFTQGVYFAEKALKERNV